jgi:hypothetical protein
MTGVRLAMERMRAAACWISAKVGSFGSMGVGNKFQNNVAHWKRA